MRTILITVSFFAFIFLIYRLKRGIEVVGSYQSISPEEVKKRMEEGEKFFLIDVRTPDEYAQKHIPKSISVPLDRLEEEIVKIIPDKAALIIVYCQSGRRSANGASIFTKLGYSNVFNLGGIINWPYKTESGRKSDV